LDLGLKPETADMCYTEGSMDAEGNIEYHLNIKRYWISLPTNYIPAWSLHRLIELGCFNVECKGIFWRVTGTYVSESCDKIYDTIIDSIEALITEDLFNKEYLKQ
jgi:hypothetical protein